MDREAPRHALRRVDRERMRVVDHAMPRWIAPAMAVVFAIYFPIQDLAGPGVRHAMVFVFSLGFVGFVLGPVLRQRRMAQSGLPADLVSVEHRRRAQLAATVLLVLLLGGMLLLDHLTWPHVGLAYGLALAATVLVGGWWLRRTLAHQLRTLPSQPSPARTFRPRPRVRPRPVR